jgi:hypothetical protein
MKAYRRESGTESPIFKFGIRGERSTSYPGKFTFGKEPRYPLNKRLLGPTVGLGVTEKSKILAPTGTQIADNPARP